MARPTLLNEVVAEDLERAVVGGAFDAEAAAYAGVGERTFYEWLQRGRDYDEIESTGGDPPENDAPFADLFRRIRKARARVRVAASGTVMNAITASGPFAGRLPDAHLALRFLERVDPERWGRVWRNMDGKEAEPGPSVEALAERAEHLLDELAAKREERQAAEA